MERYKYSWIRVSHDQMERWLGPMVTPHEFNRSTAPEYEKHYTEPSGTAEKEEGKRYRLAGRMFEYIDGAMRATSQAQNKILALMKGWGIMGLKNETDSEVESELANVQREAVTEAMNNLLDMPWKVRNIYNYPGTAAASALVTFLQAKKIIKSMYAHTRGQADSVTKAITTAESKF
jgi:hypothetical protein